MKRVITLSWLGILCVALAGCGGQATSNPGVDISGNWNAYITQAGQTTPSYAFGMKFSKDQAVITGSEITFTGSSQPNTGCINYGSLTASGNVSNESQVTITVTDPTTNSSFTIDMTPNASVTEMDGNFNAIFGANGSSPACAAESGSVTFTKQ